MHFAVLPPEVNSGRMYAGPGVGPMLTAASAWDELANDLHSAADDFEGVVSGLTSDPWQGPAAESIVASAAPQTEWLRTTAAQATQAGTQAKAAASAYESAFSLQSLESSSGLTGFDDFSNVYDLAELGTGLLGNGTGLIGLSGAAGFITKAEDKIVGDPDAPPSSGPKPQAPSPAPRGSSAPKGATAVSAEMGESGSLGRLSVPQGWASAAPQIRLAALEAPMPSAAPASASGMLSDMPLLGQAPLMAMPGRDSGRGPQAADRGAPARQRAAVVATPETSSEDRATGAASQMREITDVLSKLADLRDNGALTDQEFNEQKHRLLGGR
jgi:PPE-repeat protein